MNNTNMSVITDNIDFTINKGFTNFGNTCFYNSTLQAIFKCKLLIEKLKNYNGENKLLRFLKITIYDYYIRENVETIGPRLLLQSYRNMNNSYHGGTQEDAGECLTYFLDNFDMATKSEGLNITELFDCHLVSQLECPNCNYKTESNANEKVIVLPINKYTTFNEAMDNFLSVEKLSDDNLWTCEKCNLKVAANKKLIIRGSPEYMFIGLKRFEHEYIKLLNRIRVSKITHNVEMPDDIIINDVAYEIKGCIMHMGSLNGGHYVYFHKIDNKWVIFNDESISNVNNTNIQNNGYIYTYVKKT